ncbi:MAG: response regulator transcription factor [Anaerolineales bacterium]
MAIRVAIVEDHPLMVKAIVDVLSNQPDITVVGTSNHGFELPKLVRETSPDVVILDLGMTGENFEPISAVQSLLHEHPEVRILILTGYDDEIYVRQLVDAVAYGYVLKSDDLSLELPNGVRRVFDGKRFYSTAVVDKLFANQKPEEVVLSEQELIVLRLAAKGHSNTSIAQSMNISERRVRNLLSGVYSKFDIREAETINVRVAAINKARELGLLLSD